MGRARYPSIENSRALSVADSDALYPLNNFSRPSQSFHARTVSVTSYTPIRPQFIDEKHRIYVL